MIRQAAAKVATVGGNGHGAKHEPDALIQTIIARHKETAALVRKHGGIQRNLTDLGNAERFVQSWGQDVLFDHTAGRWLLFDGRRYRPDETGAVFHLARATVRAIYNEAALSESKSEREALAGWAKSSESAMRQRALLELARVDPVVAVTHKDLDADGWLLNLLNGSLDLRTGELQPHSREDRLTRLAPVAYEPQAVPERFLRFLDEISLSRTDLQAFLQTYFGYSLSASTRDQCFAVLWGSGQNGKTTLVNLVTRCMGDYSAETPVETLMIQKNQGIPNDLARLRGLRLVTARESEQGQRLAESLVKALTGGDKITARFLHQEWFEFTPTFKLVLFTNHRPRILGTDLAIWRRVRLIPFSYTVPEDRKNSDLEKELFEAEAPGILRWLVEGCLEWQREGLPASDTVKAATSEYRSEEDTLSGFLAEHCILENGASAASATLYRRYRSWAEQAGERIMTQTAFSLALQERGFSRWPNKRHAGFEGIGLQPEADPGNLFESER
jgi:putative DNA primase/helicase